MEGNLARVLFEKIKTIKLEHPAVSQRIDDLEEEIRVLMNDLQAEISRIESDEERKLMTILIINEVHRSIEGILSGA
jgi:hypothetical protein